MASSTQDKEKKSFREIFGRIRNIFFSVILGVLVVLVIIILIARFSGATPKIFGFALYRVSTGSMSPTYEVGDIILAKDCDPSELRKGDVVTYEAQRGALAGNSVTHRVIKAPFQKDGKTYIVTKGDANTYDDGNIDITTVDGIVLTKISIMSAIYSIFITPAGLLILIGLIILAFFNEIIIFVKALFGIGYEDEPEESVDDIIRRYQQENQEKDSSKKPDDADTAPENDDSQGGEV